MHFHGGTEFTARGLGKVVLKPPPVGLTCSEETVYSRSNRGIEALQSRMVLVVH
jgi:hypothetical protein